jgi:hypothetical protein
MSSFNNHNDGKLKELSGRLSKIKNPSGKEPASFADLQSRYESLRGPPTTVSLDDLNLRFDKLEDDQVERGNSINNMLTSQLHRGDIDLDLDDDEGDEDDFMSFINDSLTMNVNSKVNYSHNTNINIPADVSSATFNEAHLLSVEHKSDLILGDIKRDDNMSNMEDLLYDSPATSGFMSFNLPTSSSSQGSYVVPNKDKSELDLLLEQIKDESRLLRNPIRTACAGPSDDATEHISQLVMAARDAAYLDNKYGSNTRSTIAPVCDDQKNSTTTPISRNNYNHSRGDKSNNKNMNIPQGANVLLTNTYKAHSVGDDEEEDGASDDEVSDGGRSYGSNISDESSLGDSD